MGEIIALGGGGFSMEESALLDLYILGQAKRQRPKVCFLPTASGDAEEYIGRFYMAFSQLACEPMHLSLFKTPPQDAASVLLDSEMIYVGGGNTRSMLALWREWGVDEILRQAYQQGSILAGISAGAICWFEQGLSDSVSQELAPIECLGFLQGSCSPHFDGEADRRPTYLHLLRSGKMLPGYGIDDGCALHFIDSELRCAVASRPKAKAYRFSVRKGVIDEQIVYGMVLEDGSKDDLDEPKDILEESSVYRDIFKKGCNKD